MPDSEQDDPIAAHRDDWHRLIGDDTALTGVARRYRERHRRYHTTAHVLAVVRHVHELAATEVVADLGAVVAAAWYHDAVYEPRSTANERASARLAQRDLLKLGWDVERVDAVGTMIEGTARHADPADLDTAVLYDADLAILGAEREAYGTYVDDVRSEYSHVDDEAWRAGRAEVLEAFLGRTQIYATATGHQRWESQARTNLADELAEIRR